MGAGSLSSQQMRTIAWALIAVGALFRVLGHLNSGLWYDEIWTLLDFGRLPLGELLTTYGSDNNHPLFSLSAWASLHLFGESAWALRLPAVVFGVASLWASYNFAAWLSDQEEALWTLALLTLSYHHVWFSQNARGYSALLFFSVWGVHHFLKGLEERQRRDFVIAAIAFALGSYVHLTGVFVAVAAGLTALVSLKESKAAARAGLIAVVAAGALSLLLHAAIIAEMLAFFTKPAVATAAAVTSEWTSPWWTVKAAAQSLGLGLGIGLAAFGGAAVVMISGCLSWLRLKPKALICLLLPAVLGAIVLFGLGRNLWPRFFFFSMTFFVIIGVRGGRAVLAQVFSGRRLRTIELTALALALLAFAAILPRAWALPKQDFEGALAWVRAQQDQSTPVYTVGLTQLPLASYYQADFPHIASAAELETAVLNAPEQRLWVLHTLPGFLDSTAPELAKRLLTATERQRFRGSVGAGDVIVLELRSSSNTSTDDR